MGKWSRTGVRRCEYEVGEAGRRRGGDILLIPNRIPRTVLKRPTQFLIRLLSVPSSYPSRKDVERKMEETYLLIFSIKECE
jgi:hypothetical protein